MEMKKKWYVFPWYKIDWNKGENGQRVSKSCVTEGKAFKTLFFAKRYAFLQAKKNSECVVIESCERPCNYYATWGNKRGIWSPSTGKDLYSPLLIRK